MHQAETEAETRTEVSLFKRFKCFPSTIRRKNLKTQESPIILDLCLRKLDQGNHVIIVTRHRFRKWFPSTRKRKTGVFQFLQFKERFGKAPFFRDGLVWTVGLTVEIKLRFRDGLVWTVGLTVEIKLRFRDGLVWTVGLTVEIKLRFRDGLVWTAGLTVEIKLRLQISPA